MRMKTENLTKIYKSRVNKKENFYAAKDVNITLMEGETIGLFGDSGSGKSTLGQMLSGLLKPTSGRIFFEEDELKYPLKVLIGGRSRSCFSIPKFHLTRHYPCSAA